jgi:hypothetical protein
VCVRRHNPLGKEAMAMIPNSLLIQLALILIIIITLT